MQIIDKSSPMPYYEQVAELLRQEIKAYPLQAEVYQLPSENEIAERHGITRATVRHALSVLEREGWIYREKGKGSFAAVRRVEHEVNALVSTTEDMQRRGWNLLTKVISVKEIPASPHVARALEIPVNAPIYELCRLRLVNDESLSLQTTFISAELCPHLEKNDLTQSLYYLYENRYGLRLWTGREILRARCVNIMEAELLEVPENTAVMAMERISYAATGVAVEYVEAIWRGDRYDFKVTLSRPHG
jgi:GntR family transcriptional regulator